jgi:hypothetical protein
MALGPIAVTPDAYGLVAQEAAALRQHEGDEHHLAYRGDDQREPSDVRMEGAVDQHRADQRDQGAPVADDYVCDRSFERRSEGGRQRRLRGDERVEHRAGQHAGDEHDPLDVPA